MKLSEILKKRIIVLSGKGGVGKTTVAVMLGLLATRLKKNTLLIEINSTERIAPLFGQKKVGHKEFEFGSNLSGINLRPSDCFEEYVLTQVKFKTIYDLFLKNKYITAFVDAVPGLHDLLVVGKICDLERKKKPKKDEPLYDLIIVDGPATGHGVSMFEVPQIVCDAVQVGPMNKQAAKILSVLRSPEKTVFCPVTIAEEMPVSETIELTNAFQKKLKMNLGTVFLNNLHSSPFTKDDLKKMEESFPDKNKPLYPYYAYSKLVAERAALNKKYAAELSDSIGEKNIFPIRHLDKSMKSSFDLKPLVDDLFEEMSE